MILENNVLDFFTAIQKLPESLQTEMSENYGYLWAKCSMMKNMGFEKFAMGDYFHFPLKVWVTEDFESVINQILNDLKGFSSGNPIEISDTITIHQYVYSMHFKINLIQDFDDGLIKVNGNHLIENDNDIILYFIQKKL